MEGAALQESGAPEGKPFPSSMLGDIIESEGLWEQWSLYKVDAAPFSHGSVSLRLIVLVLVLEQTEGYFTLPQKEETENASHRIGNLNGNTLYKYLHYLHKCKTPKFLFWLTTTSLSQKPSNKPGFQAPPRPPTIPPYPQFPLPR